jgi:hypothetical protein
MRERFGLSTQLLHACRIDFRGTESEYKTLGYLAAKTFEAEAPARFKEVLHGLGGRQQVPQTFNFSKEVKK